jgi:hypothetical protein
MSSGKRKRLTLAQKIEVIKFVEAENVGVRAVAEKFDIGKTQVSDILKNKVYLSQTFVEKGSENSKRKFPKSDGEIIDIVIFQWYLHARVNNLPISGPLLKEKALELASEVGLNDFKASNGWLQKFKERHQISYKSTHRVSDSVKQCIVTEWFDKVKELINGYNKCDIYNCDETGLFYRITPEKTMNFINETCSEGNLSKERLTVMLCTNIIGDFEKPLIIGKIGKHTYFKDINMDDLGIIWKSNTKAWMTRDIMTEWLLDLDFRMTQAKRNIILFLDNASSHPLLSNLQSVKLMFFPQYISSFHQPLYQGIFQNFKILYRKYLLRHLQITLNNSSESMKKINVLNAIIWIKSAINDIKRSTVENCFIKSGLFASNENKITEEQFSIDDFKKLLACFVSNSVKYEELDNKLLTENESLNLTKIMQELIDPQISEDEDEENNDEVT